MLQINSAHEVKALVPVLFAKPGDLNWLTFINALALELKDQINHPSARAIAEEWLKITSPIFSSALEHWRYNIPIANSNSALVVKTGRDFHSESPTALISFDNMLADAKFRITSVNGQQTLFNQRFYYQFCVICKQATQDGWSDIIARKGIPMSGSWYNFNVISSDANEIKSFTAENFGMDFWNILGTCGRGAKCSPFCLSCDSRVGPLLSLALLEAFSQEHFCVECTMRGLVSVQPPKPNLQELRLYRKKFSKKGA